MRLIAISPARSVSVLVVGFSAFALPLFSLVLAQPAIQAAADRNGDSSTLSDQVEALRKRIAILRVELERDRAQGTSTKPAQPGTPASATPDGEGDSRASDSMANRSGGGMTMPQLGGGGASQGSAPMSSSSSGAMGGMGQMMSMMGQMMSASSPPSAGASAQVPDPLPGFTGTPHLYHVGANDFFLDHATYILLTTEQQSTLENLREKAMRDRAAAEHSIVEGEQHLFMLTGAEQPDAAAIEAQVRAIEELRVRRRLGFIRAVGQAAQVLTDDQRRALLAHQDRPGGSRN